LQRTIKQSTLTPSATGGNRNCCHGNQNDTEVNLILNVAMKEFCKSVFT
jgi:hypothetical protein